MDADKAIPRRFGLMANDMFDGWGIRTLSANACAYNPQGYQVGAVWPHDNSLIAAGLRRYRCDAAFMRVFRGLVEAAAAFPIYRLPELFSGFGRAEFDTPVRYPVACHLQAWAAGAVPFLLATSLGLMPEAFDHRLRIVRPLLPPDVHQLDLHGLRVGQAKADLRFTRTEDGAVAVDVLKTEGDLDVLVDATNDEDRPW